MLADRCRALAISESHLLVEFGEPLDGLADRAVCEARHDDLCGAPYWGRLGGCNRERQALQTSKTEIKPSPVDFSDNDNDSKALSMIEREHN